MWTAIAFAMVRHSVKGVQCSRELNFFFPWGPIDSLKLKDQYHLQLPIFSGLYSLWGLAVPFTHCSKFRQLAPLGIPPIELGKLFNTLYSRGELDRYNRSYLLKQVTAWHRHCFPCNWILIQGHNCPHRKWPLLGSTWKVELEQTMAHVGKGWKAVFVVPAFSCTLLHCAQQVIMLPEVCCWSVSTYRMARS